jgi:DNA-binding MarR family transcriptional regulator
MTKKIDVKLPPEASCQAPRIELGGLSDEIGFALRFAQLAVFKDLISIFKPFDLRPGQYAVLKIIEANPGMPQGRLGELLNIQKTNLVALIDEFKRRGLVTKERLAGDGRQRRLTLSSSGIELMGKVEKAHDLHRAHLAKLLNREEKSQLLSLLERLTMLGNSTAE